MVIILVVAGSAVGILAIVITLFLPTRKNKKKPGQPFGNAAKKFTEIMLPPGTRIRLVTEPGRERGVYNRPLGVVYRGYLNVNLALIAAGLAHTFPYPTPEQAITCNTYRLYVPYAYAEYAARQFKKGMWGANGLMEFPQNYRRRTDGRATSKVTLPQYSSAVIKLTRKREVECRN